MRVVSRCHRCQSAAKFSPGRLYVIFIEQQGKSWYYNNDLGESSLDHRRREEFPVIFFESNMRELSIFIDESGDFGGTGLFGGVFISQFHLINCY